MKKLIIIVLFLILLFYIFSDEYNIEKTSQKITIEILSPFYEKIDSNIYCIEISDWLDMKKKYYAIYIKKSLLYICMNSKTIFFLIEGTNGEYTTRDNVAIKIIYQKDSFLYIFSENNLSMKIKITYIQEKVK